MDRLNGVREWLHEVVRSGQSLRRQAVLGVAVATMVTGLLFAGFNYVRERDFLLDTMEQMAIARLDNELLRSPESAQRFWLRLVGETDSLLKPMYLIAPGVRRGDLGSRLQDPGAFRLPLRKDLVDASASRRSDIRVARRTSLWHNRAELHLIAQSASGEVQIGFAIPGLDMHLLGNMAHNALGLLVTALLAGILLYIFLSVWLIRKIRMLRQRFLQIEKGEKPDPLPVGGDDEMDQLFVGFNHMVTELEATDRLRFALADEQAGRREDQEQFAVVRQREVEQRYAALGRLSAGIAHEVNNPLTFIRGAIGPLKRHLQPLLEGREEAQRAPVEELLAVVEEGVERATQIVADMRLLSGTGGVMQSLDVAAGVRQALRLIGWEQRTDRRFVVELPDALPPVRGQEGLLLQVWSNLLVNAIEATEAEQIIKVSAREEDSHIVVTVEDAGEGLPDIAGFDPFEPFASGKESGTGLGLPLVKSLVEKHGGVIELSASSLGGVCATVRLPREERST